MAEKKITAKPKTKQVTKKKVNKVKIPKDQRIQTAEGLKRTKRTDTKKKK